MLSDTESTTFYVVFFRFPAAAGGNAGQGTGGDQAGNFQEDWEDDLYS